MAAVSPSAYLDARIPSQRQTAAAPSGNGHTGERAHVEGAIGTNDHVRRDGVVAEEIRDQRMLIVGTYRTDEVRPALA